MKVFLKEDVKSLGKMGDIVNVAEGYARNFLIPKKFAVEANTKNIKEFEHNKRVLQLRADKLRQSFKSIADKIASLTVEIKARAGEEEKLFGSITNMDIADALKAQGIEIDKKRIVLDEPIKRLGSYSVEVKLHSDITATVNVNVVQE